MSKDEPLTTGYVRSVIESLPTHVLEDPDETDLAIARAAYAKGLAAGLEEAAGIAADSGPDTPELVEAQLRIHAAAEAARKAAK